MKAVILAAGQGTRLGNLTTVRPKPMLPVGGQPLLEHTIGWLRGHGISEIAINLHHHGRDIEGQFGSGESLGVSITYSVEERLLGTSGAVKKLADFLDESFVVVYGDVLTNVDLSRLYSLHTTRARTGHIPSIATLALYRVQNPTECGLIELGQDQCVVGFTEKPKLEDVRTDLAFTGVMVCEPSITDYIRESVESDFGFDVFPELLRSRIPFLGYVLESGEYVVDIGTVPGYRRAMELAWGISA